VLWVIILVAGTRFLFAGKSQADKGTETSLTADICGKGESVCGVM